MAGDEVERRDSQFVGQIPEVYERLMVPMIFEAAATHLAGVVAETSPGHILETAAGTGALTRALIRSCPGANITATDLNQPMLDSAAQRSPEAGVDWRQADALDLPFEDQSFDAIACQFGVMFFPDRVRGYSEALRVLRPGGSFFFNTWDRLENNDVTFVIESALVAAAPDNPLDFMGRKPHGYFSTDQIRADLEAAGLTDVTITPLDGTSLTTAAEAAVAFCQGTPLRMAIEAHDTIDVAAATRIAESALRDRYGDGVIDAPIRSFTVVARPGST